MLANKKIEVLESIQPHLQDRVGIKAGLSNFVDFRDVHHMQFVIMLGRLYCRGAVL